MHPVGEMPEATPEKPFDAWLTVLFQIDPRFGSHFYLASISIIRPRIMPIRASSAGSCECAVRLTR